MDTQTVTGIPQIPKSRYCPNCNKQVDKGAISCPSCQKSLYERYRSAAVLAYLWAALPAGVAFIIVKLVEYLFNFQNRTVEMAIFGIVFMGAMSQKKAELLSKRDLSIYRSDSKDTIENSGTNKEIKITSDSLKLPPSARS